MTPCPWAMMRRLAPEERPPCTPGKGTPVQTVLPNLPRADVSPQLSVQPHATLALQEKTLVYWVTAPVGGVYR